jgi:cytochrome c-type biogenesis protein CcmE
MSIESVRALPDGAEAAIEGVLTTEMGSLESARSGFLQDATAGIAVYLDAAFDVPVPAGWRVRATGVLDSRFGQRTLRVDRDQLVVLGEQWLPTPLEAQTGAASEPLEGLRLQVTGTVTEAPSDLSDGVGLMVDDGSGEVRVIAGPAALGDASPVRGSIVVARGPLGQRDSSGTGLGGYRLHATLAGELEVFPAPSPTPTTTAMPTATPTPTASPSPVPTAQPTGTPGPTATASASASPSPTPSEAPLTVAAARATAIGTAVVVRGVVVAEPGRLGTPSLLAIADQTGGLAVKLPDAAPGPARGVLVEVRGALADPYGQLEVRPMSDGLRSIGTATPPTPVVRPAGSIGEGDEGRLVRVAGTIDASAGKSTSHDLSFTITGGDGESLRVLADASSGLDAALFRKGATVTLTGIVGQRASRKGALDGYRLWLRDRADVTITAQPAPTATPRGGASPTPGPDNGSSRPRTISIRNALLRDGQRVTVEGTITVSTALLDSSGRRTIVEDDTAAIEVYLAAPAATVKVGARLRVTGTVGQAWGAPRLRADETRVVGSRRPSVHAITSAPTAALEWRLVKVGGSIVEVHRNGDRWTADLQVGAARVLVSGLAGSGIASTDLVEGRSATITGIVKRPYPTATDRRFAIVPRQRADVVLGRAAPGDAASPASGSTRPAGSTMQASGALGPGAAITGLTTGSAIDIDLVDLEAHTGQRVRVGGLVTTIEADGVRLDDGTAEARIVLDGDASALAGTLLVGDALNATGQPEMRGEPVLVVTTPDAIELVGDLGDAAAAGSGAATADSAVVGAAVASPQAPMRAVAAPGLGLDSFSTGIGTLVLLAVSSVGVALARRQRAQRLFRARIVARLEAIGRGVPAPDVAPDPDPQRPLGAPIGAGTGAELGRNVRGSA